MLRTSARPLLATVAALLLTATSAVTQSAASRTIEPLPDSMLRRVADEVGAPAGFQLSVFAAPPHLTYPTCLEPGSSGVLYVCTDPNLLFGRERHRGRILRLVDADGDGVADRYTVFADSLDAVRGIAVDGETVYAMHAPTLTAYRDTNGDGVADEERVLVRGLGFGLDDRNGDHTANGLRLGIDGWIYIAVGDYGFLGATGTDGTQISLHAGGVVRVRPDGSELEIVARGTRNIYDVAIDPFLRIFARDNTNNGQGWNSRFHYLPTGVDAGYPSLFRNFADEAHAPVADFGAGAATTSLWVDEPSFPEALSSGLLSADWALNRIYLHRLTPHAASFEASQEELMSIPHPVDMEVDEAGNLFVASLSGGSYDYAGEHVGYVVRLHPLGAPRPPPPVESMDEPRLLEAVASSSAMRRLRAQRELIHRGLSATGVTELERAMEDRALPVPARVAALFSLKQAQGPASHSALLRAAREPSLRAMALRALTDRKAELAGVPSSLFAEALADTDVFVRLQAVTGLIRLASAEAPELLMTAATSPERTIAHVARNGLVTLEAAEVALEALDSGGDVERATALYVLRRLHSPGVVSALAERLDVVQDPELRREIVGALARLHHREGFWDGEWWGNQPSTEGPYFDPVRWSESARIRPVLVEALDRTRGEDLRLLASELEREGLVPREATPILTMLDEAEPVARRRLLDALVGGRQLRAAAFPLLTLVAEGDAAGREAVVRMLVAATDPPPASAEAIRDAALDRSLPVELRVRALAALARIPGMAATGFAASTFGQLLPELEDQPALLQAWRRFVSDRARVAELDAYAFLAAGIRPPERVVGFAVLVQIAGASRNPEPSRARAAAIIDRAWDDPLAAEALERAITLLGVEERYEEQLKSE